MPSPANQWDKAPPCPSERSSDVLPQRSPLSPRTARRRHLFCLFSPPCSPRLPPRLRVSASNRAPRALHRPPCSKVLSALISASLRLWEITFRSGNGFTALRCVFLLSTLLLSSAAASLPYFSVLCEDAGAWPDILSSIGLERQPPGVSRIFVARTGAAASVEWPGRIERGAILILEGESSLADLFGFRRGRRDPVRVQSLTDVHRPTLPIVWEQGLELPVFDMPPGAVVFATHRWTGAPMSAGLKRGSGAILWVAAPPGARGSERFSYLLNALA